MNAEPYKHPAIKEKRGNEQERSGDTRRRRQQRREPPVIQVTTNNQIHGKRRHCPNNEAGNRAVSISEKRTDGEDDRRDQSAQLVQPKGCDSSCHLTPELSDASAS